jgi:hypothetical protein
MIAVRAWTSLDREPPRPPLWLSRVFALVLMLVAVLLGISWTAQLVPIALTGAVGPEYQNSPSAFWTIRIVDLGFIVPVAIWTGYGLWQGRASAIKAAYALATFLTMQGASVFETVGVIFASRTTTHDWRSVRQRSELNSRGDRLFANHPSRGALHRECGRA